MRVTQAQFIPFGEWLPDLPEIDNPGAIIAKNVIPEVQGYRPFPSISDYSDALAGPCIGTFWTVDQNGLISNFAGDSASLYRLLASSSWDDVSGTSAPYNASNWDFTKFGDRVIATSLGDPTQYYDVGISAVFADLPGAPVAKTCATIRDFVMLGDIDGLGSNFIQWCGYNNTEAWTPSIRTQADYQELFGRAGAVQRIVPGEFAVIFCEHSIYRADYVGPPIIFQIDEVERKRGTPSPNSVVWTGGLTYYFGWDGFYVFDGQQSQSISHNRVSRWFKENCPPSTWGGIRATVDRLNRVIIWAFKTSASEPFNNRLLVYNWAADKWAYAELVTQVIDEFVSPGFSLDALDGPLPGGIDLDSIPVDSDAYSGGFISVEVFNASNIAGTLDGPPLVATLDTLERAGPDTRRQITNRVRPVVEGNGATLITLQVGKRNTSQEVPQFTLAKGQNGLNGDICIRENARYQRYRLNIADGFDMAVGVTAHSRLTGGQR